jgi:hypothetical protein
MPPRAGVPARRALAVSAIAIAGCTAVGDPAPGPLGQTVTVALRPVRETTARGDVVLVQEARRVRVAARLSGLRPRWSYTLFLAERGDCGGSEAGGARTVPLAGALRSLSLELPPLLSDAEGNAVLTLHVPGTIAGKDSDFAGRALVVQPDGYGRAACGGVPAS